MLATVLLHVIEAAGPIDATLDLRSVHGRLGDMDNALAFLEDFQDRRIGNPAKVVWLAAGSRIEGGPIQTDAAPVGAPVHNRGREVAQVGIVVVEALGRQTHSRAPFL